MSCMILIDAARKDDWDATQLEIFGLQAKGKVIFYQKYDRKHEDVRKKPFIVVIQDEFMRDIAKRFSTGSSWALDSTFKTNNYDYHYTLRLFQMMMAEACQFSICFVLKTKDKAIKVLLLKLLWNMFSKTLGM